MSGPPPPPPPYQYPPPPYQYPPPQFPQAPGGYPGQPVAGYPIGPPSQWRPKKRGWVVWTVVGVVVVVVVVVILGIFFSRSPDTVTVTSFEFTSSDNACGLRGYTAAGFSIPGGDSISETMNLTNTNYNGACTIASISTPTSGFTISGANTPLTIPARSSLNLQFKITVPNENFNGVFTLDLE